MPDVGAALAALRQVAEAVGHAQSAAAQFDERAQQVQSRAAANGFRGVADRVGAMRGRLKQIREMHDAVAATTNSAIEMVQQVTEDASPADVVSTLSPAAQQMNSASTAASASEAQLDDLAAEIAAELRGGRPGPLVGLVDRIKQETVRVIAALGTAKAAIEEAATAARQVGDPRAGAAGAGGGDGATGAGRPVPAWVAEKVTRLNAWTPHARTEGYLWGFDGEEVSHPTLTIDEDHRGGTVPTKEPVKEWTSELLRLVGWTEYSRARTWKRNRRQQRDRARRGSRSSR